MTETDGWKLTVVEWPIVSHSGMGDGGESTLSLLIKRSVVLKISNNAAL